MGFLFLVLYPPSASRRLSRRSPTHSPTHSLTLSLTHSLTHPLTHPLTHSLTPPLLRGRRGIMCTAKGSDVRPGVPWVSASFAWQAWHNVHCQGVGCTPWRPLGLRRFCVAGVAQCALPRGRITDSFAEITPALTHSLIHSLTHSPTHTHTPTHSLTPFLPHSPTHSLPLHFTSLHFTSLTHSLTYIIIITIIIIMCQRCLPATGHAERVHKMCGCARKSAEHYFGQRKYGEHTIVLIVCRKKTSEPGGTR